MGEQAPWYSYKVRSVVLQEGITYLGEGAFCDCRYLKSIGIPQSVSSVGGDLFPLVGLFPQFKLVPGIRISGPMGDSWSIRRDA